MLGTVRLLAERGHRVDVLAPRAHRERTEAAGGSWLPLPAACEFDPTLGRALEDQFETFLRHVLWGSTPATALLAAAAERRPHAIVVDHQLRTMLVAAHATGAPVAVFAHTACRYHGRHDPDWWRADAELLDAAVVPLGLAAVGAPDGPVSRELMRRSDLVLVAMPFEFDPWQDETLAIVHAGPIFEEADAALAAPPSLPGGEGPLVVVSLSSQYMHQEDLLRQILSALSELSVRIVVTTGNELDAAELELPPHALAYPYVPHRALLPHADLVVTHGGMGTIMAAFTCGVPLVVIPLGRDQPGNAARVEELGAGLSLPSGADSRAIRAAAADALADDGLRRAARRMQRVVEGYGGGERAVAALEALLQ
ncbi:MAG TPA: nucleotide disphospho-sugar-binding domain-containing protein [Gaiellaceae bacterium]|nr:nucleotide disphospho-sugar-binding domain-containing protein [Gaiellaceae bacterium]